MNIFLEKSQRLWVIILAFIIGIISVYYIIKPFILSPLGFTDTNKCLKIFYKTNGNTALIYVEPLNRWFWYNDNKIYVYGDSPDRYCNDPNNYTPVYVLQKGKEIGYQCIQKLDNVKQIYNDGKEYNIIFHCLKLGDTIPSAQNIFNILLKKGIIT